MGQNVWIKCGRTFNLLSESPAPTGAGTGPFLYKDSPFASFQATIIGTGAIGATITIQGSNEEPSATGGQQPVATVLGTITLSGTTAVSDGFVTTASWKYVRAVVSAPTGTITAIRVTMGV